MKILSIFSTISGTPSDLEIICGTEAAAAEFRLGSGLDIGLIIGSEVILFWTTLAYSSISDFNFDRSDKSNGELLDG